MNNDVKINGDVAFYEDGHVYVNVKNPNIKYRSVTTVISDYYEKFDAEFWSSYKALEKLMGEDFYNSGIKSHLLKVKKLDLQVEDYVDPSEFKKLQEEIKSGYTEKGKISAAHGTKIHKQKEEQFYVNNNVNLKDCGFMLHDGVFHCERNNFDLNRSKAVLPEYLVYYNDVDADLYLAGQIDLLIKDGEDLYIYDFKGLALDTPIPTKDGWKMMKDISVGDMIFDGDGKLTNVKHVSEIHNNPCYKITFDTNDSIVCDHEHRWVISERIKKNLDIEKEYTTEELHKLFSKKPLKIKHNPSLELEDVDLPIDPYVLGAWLGDGSKTCGMITNVNVNFWNELRRRGYTVGNNVAAENRAESRTVLGLAKELKKLNLLNNKHIPDIYLRGSHKQRLDLVRGLMDTDGYFNKSRNRCVMGTTQLWQANDMVKLITSLGWKATKIKCTKQCGTKRFQGYDVCFNATENPFLIRNFDYLESMRKVNNYKSKYKYITNIEIVETVPTKCLAVESETHTYLFGYNLTKTHNTNEKGIESKAYFDPKKKATKKMFYPVNNLEDTTLNHYTLQLSIYAWMLQQINPKFNIKKLTLVHIDRSNVETEIEIPYLKKEVERLIKNERKKLVISNFK